MRIQLYLIAFVYKMNVNYIQGEIFLVDVTSKLKKEEEEKHIKQMQH